MTDEQRARPWLLFFGPPDCLPGHLSREQLGILEFRLAWFTSKIAMGRV